MTLTRAACSSLLAALVSVVALPRARAEADAGAAPPVPACILVTGEARWVPYGYSHIVVLKNGCSRAATCIVATDVNPEPRTADVPAGTTVEVVTFMASPSATFTPRVNCKLR